MKNAATVAIHRYLIEQNIGAKQTKNYVCIGQMTLLPVSKQQLQNVALHF